MIHITPSSSNSSFNSYNSSGSNSVIFLAILTEPFTSPLDLLNSSFINKIETNEIIN